MSAELAPQPTQTGVIINAPRAGEAITGIPPSVTPGNPPMNGVESPANANSVHWVYAALSPAALEQANGHIGKTPDPIDAFSPNMNASIGEKTQSATRLGRVAYRLGHVIGQTMMNLGQLRPAHNHTTEVAAQPAETKPAPQTVLNASMAVVARHKTGGAIASDELAQAKAAGQQAWREIAGSESPEQRQTLKEAYDADFKAQLQEEAEARKVDELNRVMEQYGHSGDSLRGQLSSVHHTLAKLRGSADNGKSKLDRNKLLRETNSRYRNIRDAYLATVEDPAARAELANAEGIALAKDSLRQALESFDYAQARYDELKAQGSVSREELRDYRAARGRFHAARRDALAHGIAAKLQFEPDAPTKPETNQLHQEAIGFKEQMDEARRRYIAAARVSTNQNTPSVAKLKDSYDMLRLRWQNLRHNHPDYQDLSDDQATTQLRLEELRSQVAYRFATGKHDIDNRLSKMYYKVFTDSLQGLDQDQRLEQHQVETNLWAQERQAYRDLLDHPKPQPHPQTQTSNHRVAA